MAVEAPSDLVLTLIEVAHLLRLDEVHHADADQVRAVQRLIRQFGLRPVSGLRPYRISRTELVDWIQRQTIADAADGGGDE